MQVSQELKDGQAWQQQGGGFDAIGGGIKRMQPEEDDDDEEGDDKGEGTRSKYKCGLCGQPKKGHSCSAHKAAAEQFWGTRPYPANPTFVAPSSSAAYAMSNKRMVLIGKLRERLERRVFGQTDNGAAHARFAAPPGFPMPGMEQMYGAPAANNIQGQEGYYQQWAGQYAQAPPGMPPGAANPALYPWFNMQNQGLTAPGSAGAAFNPMSAYPGGNPYAAEPAAYNSEQMSEQPSGKKGSRGKGRRKG